MNDFEQFEDTSVQDFNNNLELNPCSFDELPVYDGDDYNELEALNWSTLSRFIKNPVYFCRHPDWKVESSGFEFGTYLHRMILEYNKYQNLYKYFDAPINPKTNEPYKSGKAYNEALEAFCLQGFIPLTQEMETKKQCIMDSIFDSGLRFGKSKTEVPIVGYLSGIKVKGRIDAYTEKDGIIDLKTTSSSIFDQNGDTSFYYKCKDLGYLYQMAFYGSIIESACGKFPPCTIIALQTVEPYQVGKFVLTSKTLKEAKDCIFDVFLPKWKSYMDDEDITVDYIRYI